MVSLGLMQASGDLSKTTLNNDICGLKRPPIKQELKMSKFVTQTDMDQKIKALLEMDNISLVDYVNDLWWQYQEGRRRMADDVSDIYEEYALARMELKKRLYRRQ